MSDSIPAEPDPPALIEIRVDDNENPTLISIRASLVHVVAPIQNELQVILDCARLALEAIESASTFSGQFADAQMHLDPANNRRLPLTMLKAEASRWILRAAFQQAVELVNQPLEQARRILALWEIKQRHAQGNSVKLDFEAGAAAFHRVPFEAKLGFLRKTYSFEIDPEAVAVVTSLHKARNCVVHRLGRVSMLDCDSTGVLRASWEEYAVLASKDPEHFSNARRVPFGETVFEGEVVQLRRLTKVREFRVGEVMELTGQDLAEICHTIHLFASQVRDDLRKKSEELGIPIDGKMMSPRLGRG